MSAPPNKSSVPLSSSSSPLNPCRPNPRPRNSESGDPMRRSFGGNPFPTGKPTVLAHHKGFHNPANSPSDISRRNSTGRESNRREFGDKENDKDQFSNMMKAPPTSKGAKNFMSPTISAASKINASPRKKVLTEKNEGARSSVSFSDVRGLILEETENHPARPTVSFSDVVSVIGEAREEPNPQIGLDEKPLAEDPYDMTVTDLGQKEALDLQNSPEPSEIIVGEKKVSVDLDPSFKISPRPTVAYTSPMVAPLDADPLMPPYDPRKNYLSPRPQFLHYRPNPRVEHYFDECRQLEDIFTSESSDTEASKDERHSENLEEPEDGVSQECESVAVEEKTVVVEDDDDEDMETPCAEEMVGESIEAEQNSKPRRFRTLKLLGMLLVLAVAYFSVSATLSPQNELYVHRDLGLYNIPPEFIESAKANFEQFGEKLRMWSESSCAYISKLISSLGEEEEQGWLQFHNLTYFLEEGSFETVFQPAKAEIGVAGSDNRDYKSIETATEADDHQEPEEPLEQESAGEDDFEAVSLRDDVEQKNGGEEISEAVSEDNVSDAVTIEFHEETEANTRTRDQEKLEITADTYIDGQALEVIEGESNSEALHGDSGQEETHNSEWNCEGEKESEIEDADVEAHEFQEDIETETIKNDEEKLGSIESAATRNYQQEETEAQVKTADSFRAEPEYDDSEVTGLSVQVTEDLGQISETARVDISTETTEAELDLLSSMADNDLEGSGPEVSAEVSQISDGNLPMNQSMLVLSSSLVIVLAASVFLFTKKAKPVMPNATASAPEPTPPIAEEQNFHHVPVENLIKERLSSLNFQTEVDDRMKESCPTEMSSSFEKRNSSFYSNKDLEEQSEAQSGARKSSKKNSKIDRNLRRESLASSASEYSIGSTSYGSFTTYERIPFKSGPVDEEVITPVRRSSRLRNQHSAH